MSNTDPRIHELIKGMVPVLVIICLLDTFYWAHFHTYPDYLTKKAVVFTTDTEFSYNPFNCDFGPLDIGDVTRYCRYVSQTLHAAKLSEQRVIHYTTACSRVKTNSACLALSYLVVSGEATADQAWSKLAHLETEFEEYIDASLQPHPFGLRILDVLRGLQKAIELGWYNVQSFNIEEYNHWSLVENGDMNWVIPSKFIAFAGPVDNCVGNGDTDGCHPSVYIPQFKKAKVTAVARLNKSEYDSSIFTKAGFKHMDLAFTDGTCPPEHVKDAFLRVASLEPVIAVHCKAGLGRTGTLIALYAMQSYGFQARPFMGWIRTCRPGSILGIQQQYLCNMEKSFLSFHTYLYCEPKVDFIEQEQGNRLVNAKARQQLRKLSSTSTNDSHLFHDIDSD